MRGRSGAVLNSALAPTGFRGGVALTVLATTGGRHHGWQMGGALNLAPHQSKQSVEGIRESLALLDGVAIARTSASCFRRVISYQMGGLSAPAPG